MKFQERVRSQMKFGNEKKIRSTVRADLEVLLHGHAILSLSLLPPDLSAPIIDELKSLYPETLIQSGSAEARFALFLFIVQDDIKQKLKSGKSVIWGI